MRGWRQRKKNRWSPTSVGFILRLHPQGPMNVYITKCQGNPTSSHRIVLLWTKLWRPTDRPTLPTPESHAATVACGKKSGKYNKLHPRGFTFRQRHRSDFKDLLSLHLGAGVLQHHCQSAHTEDKRLQFCQLAASVIFSSWDN